MNAALDVVWGRGECDTAQSRRTGVNAAALRRDLTDACVRGIATVPDQAGHRPSGGGDWTATAVTVQVNE